MTKAHHTAICTTDLDESLRFWRDGLGFEVTMDMEFRGDWPSLRVVWDVAPGAAADGGLRLHSSIDSYGTVERAMQDRRRPA